MLEEIIKQNTAAVERLTATLEALLRAGQTAQQTVPNEKQGELPLDGPAESGHTLDDVRAAIAKLDRQDAINLLAEFDVKKVSDLTPAAYGNLIKQAKKHQKAAA